MLEFLTSIQYLENNHYLTPSLILQRYNGKTQMEFQIHLKINITRLLVKYNRIVINLLLTKVKTFSNQLKLSVCAARFNSLCGSVTGLSVHQKMSTEIVSNIQNGYVLIFDNTKCSK